MNVSTKSILLVAVPILVAGAIFAWWEARHTDRGMRENLLNKARMAASTAQIEQIQMLSGAEASPTASDYLRLKEHLTAIRMLDPKIRFIYLLGRKNDGTVFFFVDSEPVGSEDESPLGEVYAEASEQLLRVFDTGRPDTEGPIPDRWGTWVSALVPIIDPQTGTIMAVLGMDIDAGDWNWTVIAKAALPVGLMLGLLIVLSVAFTARRHRSQLRESEKKYRNLFEYSRDGIVVVDKAGQFLDANQAYCDMLGYTVGELRSMDDFLQITPEKFRKWELDEIWNQRLMKDGFSGIYEKEYIRKDGTIIPIELQSFTIFDSFGKVEYLWGVARDITERKRAEEDLRESEEQVRITLEAILSPEGDIGDLKLKDIIDAPAIQAIMEDFFALTGMGVAILDLHGDVLVACGWQDICVKFHRVHPETFRNCVESDTELSRGVEPGTSKLYRCRNNMWDIATPITLGGRHMGNVFLGQFLFKDEEPDRGVFLEQARRYGFDENEYLLALDRVPRWSRAKVEQVMDFYSRFARMISDLSYGNIKLARSLTERDRLESQLLQSQKMEAVGRLAGGIAHDFNNMLSVILGNTELALAQLDLPVQCRDSLQEIHSAARRSADLTHQLLAFARRQTITPRILSLNDTVNEMLNMLQRLIGENIELIWKPQSDIWPVKIDPTQVDQVLANLLVNARDAIEGVGEVTIGVENKQLDKAYCAEHPGFVPGEYVVLTVSDSGCGMDSEKTKNIFDPFFTTKEQGAGTGLGLSMVYGIVKQNKGFIYVYSEPDKGTVFRIYLPRYTKKFEAEAAHSPPPIAPGGKETVLLVEDEPAILKLTGQMIEKLGYKVLSASMPCEAIRLAEEHIGDIHLLITDVIMPEMNGRQLAKKILNIYPGIKRLFVSGYTADIIADHNVLDESVHFLQKPFSLETLAAKIREVLERD